MGVSLTPLLQSRTSSKITVESLNAENLVIDKSNQTAIWHVKRSNEARTSGFIHFLQKCSIVKLEETMLRFSPIFDCHQEIMHSAYSYKHLLW